MLAYRPRSRADDARERLDQVPDETGRVAEVRDTVLAAVSEPKDPSAPAGSEGVLSPCQAERAALGVGRLGEPEWTAFRPEVTPAGEDRGEVVRQGLLLAAVAARADRIGADPRAFEEIGGFRFDLDGLDADQMLDQTGTDGFLQEFRESCGPTALQLLRLGADPIEALRTNREGRDDVVREQEDVLEDHWNQTAKPRLTVGKLTAMCDGSRELLAWVRGGPGSETEARAWLEAVRVRRAPLETPCFETVRALREYEDLDLLGSIFTRTITGTSDGDLVDDGNGRMGVDEVRGTLEEIDGDDLVDEIADRVFEGRDCAVRVDTGGFLCFRNAHYLVFSDVVGPKGTRQFRVQDPMSGQTVWVAERDVRAGRWGRLSEQLGELESAVG